VRYEIIHTSDGKRHLQVWLGNDAVDYDNWYAEAFSTEDARSFIKPDATVVLEHADANELVIGWLRGPVGPAGPMGPQGVSAP
jgi:hypothetical protein